MAHHPAALPRLQVQVACASRCRVAAQAPRFLLRRREATDYRCLAPCMAVMAQCPTNSALHGLMHIGLGKPLITQNCRPHKRRR